MTPRVTKQARLRSALTELCEGLRPRDMLPSERQLCAEYGVSRMTVREVLTQLEAAGLVTKEPGRGTFVAERMAQSHLHMASFTEDMRRIGRTPSTVVLEQTLATPPVATQDALGLSSGDKAYHLVRLRLADNVPISIDDSWLPAELFPDLLEHNLASSLYTLLAKEYDTTIDSAKQSVRADAADAQLAQRLAIPEGFPVLVFDRISRSQGRRVEHTVSTYHSDRYQVYMVVRADDSDLHGMPIE